MKNGKLNNMAASERPYERALRFGTESLTESELLAVILRTGTQDYDVLEISEEIIKEGSYEGVSSLLHMTYDEFIQIRGIGKVKAIQLLCIGELSKRLWRHEASKALRLNDPGTCAKYYMQEMNSLEREELRVVYLDIRWRLMGDSVLTKGTMNNSLISVREILIEALRRRAAGIIIIHNHPSGNPEPSTEDMQVTQSVKEGCDAIGIKLADHIIIGGNGYYSFRERGFL